ncbi:MAG: nitroreductase family protein [Candidatus Aminicenantes bacterium]|nr:nitroreductase family protein [Candidatus Aminicenantes bacterium]
MARTDFDFDKAGNETLKTIRERHSVRRFTEEDVGDDLIRQLLDAANRAPSAENRQSWRFLVVRGRKKEALAALASKRAAGFPRPASVLLRMAARTISAAPVVIAVANTGDLIRHGREVFRIESGETRDFFRTMEIQSSAAAVENMLLAAASLGLGAVWLGILFLIKDEVLELLGEPNGEFMAVVPVGRPALATSGPKKRPLAAVIKEIE